jgi:hypothetical protein
MLTKRLGATLGRVDAAERVEIDAAWLPRVRAEIGLAPEGKPIELSALRANHELLRRFLANSAEARAHEMLRFDLSEPVALAPGTLAEETVRRLMSAWSLSLGDGGVAAHDIVLFNPVLLRPFAATGTDEWHLFCPWLPHHSPSTLIEAANDGNPDLLAAYHRRRSEFLEERTADVFATALPGAMPERSVKSIDPADGATYENDVLARVGSHAIVVEAKGGRVAADARHGAGGPLRDKIEDLLVAPSHEARMLADRLASTTGTISFTRRHMALRSPWTRARSARHSKWA